MDEQNNPTEISQQPPIMPPPSRPRSNLPLMVLIGLVMLGIGLGGGYLLFSNSSQPDTSENTQPSTQISPTDVLTEGAPTSTEQSTVLCENKGLGIQLMIPNDWTCEVDEEASSIIITSSLFEIGISNLGRGLYCGTSGVDPTCKTSEFYKNDLVNLSLYTSEGVDGEIFGGIKSPQSPYMWITYEGMDKRKLTTTEKNKLIQVLESLTVTN